MAISYNASTTISGTMANGGTSIGFTTTSVPTVSNGLGTLHITNYDGASPNPNSKTIGGSATTNIADAGTISNQYSHGERLVLGTTGSSYAISVGWSTGQDEGGTVGFMLFDSVDQTTPINTGNLTEATFTGSATSLIDTITSVTVGGMIACSVSDYLDTAHTANNCTDVFGTLDGGDTEGMGGYLTPDGTTEIIGFDGGNGPSSSCTWEILEATGGGGGGTVSRPYNLATTGVGV